MNATSGKKTLLATIAAALALAGANRLAHADDMAGMKMDKAPAKEPAAETGGAKAKKGTEKLEVAITEKGFEPNTVGVKKGKPVELVFTRKTDQTCIKEVILDTGASKMKKAVPLNKPVVFKAKFTKAGDLTYVCNMNMFSGTVKVQ